jgi:hypothetical protein
LEEFIVRLFKQLVPIHRVRSLYGLKSPRAFEFDKGYPSTKEEPALQIMMFDDLKGILIVKL